MEQMDRSSAARESSTTTRKARGTDGSFFHSQGVVNYYTLAVDEIATFLSKAQGDFPPSLYKPSAAGGSFDASRELLRVRRKTSNAC